MSWKERWDHFREGLTFTEAEPPLPRDERGLVQHEAPATGSFRVDLSAGSETLDD